jgi:ParB/RepB/Spo0J family partition protein
MTETEKEEKIELIHVRAIKPLSIQLGIMDYETEAMLREDMRKGPDRLDPIRVRRLTPEEKEECSAKYPNAEYEVIDGHKRLRNADLLHWETIRAIVMDVSREEAYEVSYRKNRERGSIDPMLEALYFKHLYIEKKLPAFKIAETFSISERHVYRTLKRVGIQPEAVREIVKQAAMAKPLSGKHLEVIASASPEKQPGLVGVIVEGKLSAKQAEKAKEAIEKGLPKEEVIKAAKVPTPPVGEIEIAEMTCPQCGLSFKILHIGDGKHKIKKG